MKKHRHLKLDTTIVIKEPGKTANNTPNSKDLEEVKVNSELKTVLKKRNNTTQYKQNIHVLSSMEVKDIKIVHFAVGVLLDYLIELKLFVREDIQVFRVSNKMSIVDLFVHMVHFPKSFFTGKKLTNNLANKSALFLARATLFIQLPFFIGTLNVNSNIYLALKDKIILELFSARYDFVPLFSPGMSDDEITACLTPFYRGLNNVTQKIKIYTLEVLNKNIDGVILKVAFNFDTEFNDTTILTDRKLIEYIYRLYIMKDDLKIPKFTLEQDKQIKSYLTDLHVVLLSLYYSSEQSKILWDVESQYFNVPFSKFVNSEISKTGFSSLIMAIEYYIRLGYTGLTIDLIKKALKLQEEALKLEEDISL